MVQRARYIRRIVIILHFVHSREGLSRGRRGALQVEPRLDPRKRHTGADSIRFFNFLCWCQRIQLHTDLVQCK
ncbi:hypothetical protein GDO86_020518 [Hymenochirus boettgeri]|uniref:Uncharacterized protein n=1 Tax=Hymenochirus boettgeri TaxID=247094 RepID=A0A8T2IBR4_9PIPI|nr:hypothetical protein GDO86_020518 [Hymenochirus boettgeri]